MNSDMKTNHKSPAQLIAQINVLLAELEASLGAAPSKSAPITSTTTERFTGASGGIKLLLKEGFFATPKTLVEVIKRLSQEGFNYTATVVSVALLRQVRSRSLVRLPSTGAGKEKWAYAIRK